MNFANANKFDRKIRGKPYNRFPCNETKHPSRFV
jgi:hypothetical protein